MGAAEDVARSFIDPNDKIVVYEGASKNLFPWAQLNNGGWHAWDLRGWVRQLVWDLLRFQKPSDKAKGEVDVPWGLRDSVTRQHLVAEQNNWMLQKLCEANDIDLDEMPGS